MEIGNFFLETAQHLSKIIHISFRKCKQIQTSLTNKNRNFCAPRPFAARRKRLLPRAATQARRARRWANPPSLGAHPPPTMRPRQRRDASITPAVPGICILKRIAFSFLQRKYPGLKKFPQAARSFPKKAAAMGLAMNSVSKIAGE